jgi:hypothetical protein
MAQAKRASRGRRPSKAVSVLGIAGMSLAASAGESPADIAPTSLATRAAGSIADILWQNTAPFKLPSLDEEEISDVSLATFYLFDKESPGNSRPGVQLAFRGGCGCGHGCGGCGGRGCGGFRGCGGGFRGCGVGFRGCRGCGVGFRGCGFGGCGGCGGCGWGWGWGGGCCLSWGGCALC